MGGAALPLVSTRARRGKPVAPGATLEVWLRVRTPFADKFDPPAFVQEWVRRITVEQGEAAAAPLKDVPPPAPTTPTTTTTAAASKAKPARKPANAKKPVSPSAIAAAATASELADAHALGLMVAGNVLSAELVLAKAAHAAGGGAAALSGRVAAIEAKIAALEKGYANGTLTLDDYKTRVEARAAADRRLALALKRAGRVPDARRALTRHTIAVNELKEMSSS